MLRQLPHTGIVVAVCRLHHVGSHVELHPHLAEIVPKHSADGSAHCRIVPVGLRAEEESRTLSHPFVVITKILIEQRTRQPSEQARCDDRARRLRRVEGKP